MKQDPFKENYSSLKTDLPSKSTISKTIRPKDNTAALGNMTKGFDPLGGGKFKAADFAEDDDLLGWNK